MTEVKRFYCIPANITADINQLECVSYADYARDIAAKDVEIAQLEGALRYASTFKAERDKLRTELAEETRNYELACEDLGLLEAKESEYKGGLERLSSTLCSERDSVLEQNIKLSELLRQWVTYLHPDSHLVTEINKLLEGT